MSRGRYACFECSCVELDLDIVAWSASLHGRPAARLERPGALCATSSTGFLLAFDSSRPGGVAALVRSEDHARPVRVDYSPSPEAATARRVRGSISFPLVRDLSPPSCCRPHGRWLPCGCPVAALWPASSSPVRSAQSLWWLPPCCQFLVSRRCCRPTSLLVPRERGRRGTSTRGVGPFAALRRGPCGSSRRPALR